MKKLLASLIALSAIGSATLMSDSASACGGCFHAVQENTVVTGHRMAVSISKSQAVLWDQIQYAGDPAEFSWVLPVKKGAFVEVASDAFFEVLETGSTTTVEQPPEGCAPPDNNNGIGCGSSDFAVPSAGFDGEGSTGTGGGVQVVHEGTVGPYETVTLSAENPNALAQWLEDNGYVLPDDVKPIIDAYVADDFDFIALKLAPDQGVSKMKPVRVTTPGSSYTLPLRMVAAGVGESVDLVLYVIGEGRYEAAGFENGTIHPKLVSWDFKTDRSDYAEQRLGVLAGNGGRSWLTTYARKNAIMGTVSSSLGGQITYNIGENFSFADTMAEAYIMQGFSRGEVENADEATCLGKLGQVNGNAVVVDLCDDEGNCRALEAGETDSRLLACDTLDDLQAALTGMHPADVVVTRMEASLPKAALDADLRLEATMDQAEVESQFVAGLKINPCWDQQDSMGPILHDTPKHRIPPEALILLTLGAAGIALAMRRRQPASQASS